MQPYFPDPLNHTRLIVQHFAVCVFLLLQRATEYRKYLASKKNQKTRLILLLLFGVMVRWTRSLLQNY